MKNYLENWAWLVHNVVGHPVMGLCQVLGLERLGTWAHDVTIPGKTEKVETQR